MHIPIDINYRDALTICKKYAGQFYASNSSRLGCAVFKTLRSLNIMGRKGEALG